MGGHYFRAVEQGCESVLPRFQQKVTKMEKLWHRKWSLVSFLFFQMSKVDGHVFDIQNLLKLMNCGQFKKY